MRIVAGRFGGRKLVAPSDDSVRPTADRVRESLFSILASRYGDIVGGARVIDMFAGSGALGLEALSRGAHCVLFVEKAKSSGRLIRKNISALSVQDECELLIRDATRMGSSGDRQAYELVFADPPYGMGLPDKAIDSLEKGGWLSPGAMLVVEDNVASAIQLPQTFQMLDERIYGDSKLLFLKWLG